MDVHPSKPLIATGALDGSVRLSQIRKGKILHALDREDVKQAIETVGFARTHDWLASGGLDGFIDVWDVGSGACRVRFNNDGHNVVKLQWHESQPLVISASAGSLHGQCLRNSPQRELLSFSSHAIRVRSRTHNS